MRSNSSLFTFSCCVASSNQALNWAKGSRATRCLKSKTSSFEPYGFRIPPMSTAIPLQATTLLNLVPSNGHALQLATAMIPLVPMPSLCLFLLATHNWALQRQKQIEPVSKWNYVTQNTNSQDRRGLKHPRCMCKQLTSVSLVTQA